MSKSDTESKEETPRILTTSQVMEHAWRSVLESSRVPAHTHPELVKAFKRFFYAGGKALLDSFVYSDMLEDDLIYVDRVDAIMHEINAYFTEVAAGRQ